MKVCIIGAGAIGGFIGARLAAAGQCEVGALARGDTLLALREFGWRLRQDERLITASVIASSDPEELGPQDLVIIAVKGPALSEVARNIAPLIGPTTIVMAAMNGVPWWFAAGLPQLGAAPLTSVDPGGKIAAVIPLQRIIGCVVHASTVKEQPGLVTHKMGNGLIIGEPNQADSPRIRQVQHLLAQAGFEVSVSNNIRHDIWYKLWGNLTMNPVSAITGATTDRILDDPLVRKFCSAAMQEAAEIGKRIGCEIEQNPDDRHAVTRKLGAFKTSMLQDAESGQPLELDSIVAVVREIGKRINVATPNIDALFGLVRLFARTHGLYPDAVAAETKG